MGRTDPRKDGGVPWGPETAKAEGTDRKKAEKAAKVGMHRTNLKISDGASGLLGEN